MAPATVTLSAPDGYDSYAWSMDGNCGAKVDFSAAGDRATRTLTLTSGPSGASVFNAAWGSVWCSFKVAVTNAFAKAAVSAAFNVTVRTAASWRPPERTPACSHVELRTRMHYAHACLLCPCFATVTHRAEPEPVPCRTLTQQRVMLQPSESAKPRQCRSLQVHPPAVSTAADVGAGPLVLSLDTPGELRAAATCVGGCTVYWSLLPSTSCPLGAPLPGPAASVNLTVGLNGSSNINLDRLATPVPPGYPPLPPYLTSMWPAGGVVCTASALVIDGYGRNATFNRTVQVRRRTPPPQTEGPRGVSVRGWDGLLEAGGSSCTRTLPQARHRAAPWSRLKRVAGQCMH